MVRCECALMTCRNFGLLNSDRYLKCIDRFYNNYVSCFLTGGSKYRRAPRIQASLTLPPDIKFLLLHSPTTPAANVNSTRASTSIAANPTSPQTEEAIRQFFTEVYENWIKIIMNPFYMVNMEVKSPVFRQRVAASAKKYL